MLPLDSPNQQYNLNATEISVYTHLQVKFNFYYFSLPKEISWIGKDFAKSLAVHTRRWQDIQFNSILQAMAFSSQNFFNFFIEKHPKLFFHEDAWKKLKM